MTNIFGRPLIWHLLKRIQKVKYKIKVVELHQLINQMINLLNI